MTALSRASTGVRLEDGALAAARAAAAGRPEAAVVELAQMKLVLDLAAQLRDLAGAELSRVQAAVDRAQQTLHAGR